ncbi:MAG: hypothetical protein IPG67_18120 [Acidobacteria bacterium]|nr:hypothetical protein [Acidobacteriota bacterium]
MRTSTILKALAVALTLNLAGCTYIFGPVKLAQAFTDAKSQVIDEMAKALEKSPTSAGVAEARKAFEAKKPELIAKRDELKAGPKGMNVDWQTELSAMEGRQGKQLDGVGVKLSVDSKESCTEVTDGWKKLRKEFDESVYRY